MTVAIYARVSTSDQNPELQLVELREFAKRRKFQIIHEYVDQVSGNLGIRRRAPAYDSLLKDAYRRRFDCVLVWKFDRFARSLPGLLGALKNFDALGINFISATQQIDTTTPMGRLFFSIVGSFAEFERELIIERTRAGVVGSFAQGQDLTAESGCASASVCESGYVGQCTPWTTPFGDTHGISGDRPGRIQEPTCAGC